MNKIKAAKKPRKLATAHQYDEALLEQIKHARLMNVPRNALSSAVSFSILVGNRLYGERTKEQRTPEFHETITRVMEDARIERAEAHLKEEEMRRQQDSRIIMPGRSS